MKYKIILLPIILFVVIISIHFYFTNNTIENRVEIIIPEENEINESLAKIFSELHYEENRFVINNPNVFSAQKARFFLSQNSLSQSDFFVLDYSWANSILKQSSKIWLVTLFFCILLLYSLFIYKLIIQETNRWKQESKYLFFIEYLKKFRFQILLEIVHIFLLIVLSIYFSIWFLKFNIIVPGNFFPQENLFDLFHYVDWFNSSFPTTQMSSYAKELKNLLLFLYTLSFLECIMIFSITIIAKNFLKGALKNGNV